MIVSVSSRTDIPAFYGEWFQRRLDAGYSISVNPFSGLGYRVGLMPHEVDGFVFWTKNLGPFLSRLPVLKERGFPFVIQYTINRYPHALEPSVPRAGETVEHLRLVARTYGRRAGVWRYDPIILTNLTDFHFHRENFSQLAASLAGSVDEVTVSYASLDYRKTRRNLDRAERRGDFMVHDPEDAEKREFLADLASIAVGNGMKLSLCGQPQYLTPCVQEASCVDARRLSEVAGRSIVSRKPGHRGERCACDYSRDIGAYDTCLHGCAYCYALSDVHISRRFHRQHDPSAEWLRPPRRAPAAKQARQLEMF